MNIGIVGAGIAGRLLAWRLHKLGYQISLFDKNARQSEKACSFAAAGILSPYAELENAELEIFKYGSRSMQLYPAWLAELKHQVFFKQIGSIVTAHKNDQVELEKFYQQIKFKLSEYDFPEYKFNAKKIAVEELESELAIGGNALFLEQEGQIDPIELLKALDSELETIDWQENCEVISVKAKEIITQSNKYSFDFVFDCRGLGAKNELPLRGVRGELLWLKAPDVSIEHLTRLMHPRYRIYVVPRPNDVYIIGASEIESEDLSEISVRSSLELLSAAYSLHKGFGEARIIKQVVNCRPALPDNLPLIKIENGLGTINGLYRHGILLAPALVEKAIAEFEKSIGHHDSKTSSRETYAINS